MVGKPPVCIFFSSKEICEFSLVSWMPWNVVQLEENTSGEDQFSWQKRTPLISPYFLKLIQTVARRWKHWLFSENKRKAELGVELSGQTRERSSARRVTQPLQEGFSNKTWEWMTLNTPSDLMIPQKLPPTIVGRYTYSLTSCVRNKVSD